MRFPFSRPDSQGLELTNLYEVKWDDLQHAYGSANDIPGLLRDLASRNRERGEKAMGEFYGNIWHQGTTYQATRYAVPFLRQIVADELNPFRTEVLELLAHLAFGHSYHDVHQHMIFFEDERDTPEFQQKVERELSDVQLAHEAVRAGVPQYLGLWDAPTPELRTGAIYLASLFGKLNPEVADARRQNLASETDDAARAALWMGWFYCEPTPDDLVSIERAFAERGANGALQSWALSALIMRHSRDQSARDAAAQTMIGSLEADADRGEKFAQLPHFEDGLAAASLNQLLALGLEARRFTPAFVALLERAEKQYPALSLLESLCPLYFGEFGSEKPVTWAELDESQREIARAMADSDAVWGDGKIVFVNLSEQLRYFGLPDSREAMRALIAEQS